MTKMDGHLVTMDGKELDVGPEQIERLLSSSVPFWLDLCSGEETSPEYGLLRDTFQFHPLALEDAEHFGQRPKLDSYEGFALLVVYGPGASGQLVEVHCFSAPNYLVTVHQHPCPGMADVARRMQMGAGQQTSHVMVLYRVVDMLVDGYFPVLATFDDQIDELEDAILKAPTEAQLGQLFDMKRSLIALRKVVTPERDVFATLVAEDAIPGMTPDYERYFRDVYDHLIRVSDLVDSYRDLMSGALDTHLSTVSNRLNVVMKQLTIIATIFLPLSFLTGFFGQNFGWMVPRLGRLGRLPRRRPRAAGVDGHSPHGLFPSPRWLTASGTVPSVTSSPVPGRRCGPGGWSCTPPQAAGAGKDQSLPPSTVAPARRL